MDFVENLAILVSCWFSVLCQNQNTEGGQGSRPKHQLFRYVMVEKIVSDGDGEFLKHLPPYPIDWGQFSKQSNDGDRKHGSNSVQVNRIICNQTDTLDRPSTTSTTLSPCAELFQGHDSGRDVSSVIVTHGMKKPSTASSIKAKSGQTDVTPSVATRRRTGASQMTESDRAKTTIVYQTSKAEPSTTVSVLVDDESEKSGETNLRDSSDGETEATLTPQAVTNTTAECGDSKSISTTTGPDSEEDDEESEEIEEAIPNVFADGAISGETKFISTTPAADSEEDDEESERNEEASPNRSSDGTMSTATEAATTIQAVANITTFLGHTKSISAMPAADSEEDDEEADENEEDNPIMSADGAVSGQTKLISTTPAADSKEDDVESEENEEANPNTSADGTISTATEAVTTIQDVANITTFLGHTKLVSTTPASDSEEGDEESEENEEADPSTSADGTISTATEATTTIQAAANTTTFVGHTKSISTMSVGDSEEDDEEAEENEDENPNRSADGAVSKSISTTPAADSEEGDEKSEENEKANPNTSADGTINTATEATTTIQATTVANTTTFLGHTKSISAMPAADSEEDDEESENSGEINDPAVIATTQYMIAVSGQTKPISTAEAGSEEDGAESDETGRAEKQGEEKSSTVKETVEPFTKSTHHLQAVESEEDDSSENSIDETQDGAKTSEQSAVSTTPPNKQVELFKTDQKEVSPTVNSFQTQPTKVTADRSSEEEESKEILKNEENSSETHTVGTRQPDARAEPSKVTSSVESTQPLTTKSSGPSGNGLGEVDSEEDESSSQEQEGKKPTETPTAVSPVVTDKPSKPGREITQPAVRKSEGTSGFAAGEVESGEEDDEAESVEEESGKSTSTTLSGRTGDTSVPYLYNKHGNITKGTTRNDAKEDNSRTKSSIHNNVTEPGEIGRASAEKASAPESSDDSSEESTSEPTEDIIVEEDTQYKFYGDEDSDTSDASFEATVTSAFVSSEKVTLKRAVVPTRTFGPSTRPAEEDEERGISMDEYVDESSTEATEADETDASDVDSSAEDNVERSIAADSEDGLEEEPSRAIEGSERTPSPSDFPTDLHPSHESSLVTQRPRIENVDLTSGQIEGFINVNNLSPKPELMDDLKPGQVIYPVLNATGFVVTVEIETCTVAEDGIFGDLREQPGCFYENKRHSSSVYLESGEEARGSTLKQLSDRLSTLSENLRSQTNFASNVNDLPKSGQENGNCTGCNNLPRSCCDADTRLIYPLFGFSVISQTVVEILQGSFGIIQPVVYRKCLRAHSNFVRGYCKQTNLPRVMYSVSASDPQGFQTDLLQMPGNCKCMIRLTPSFDNKSYVKNSEDEAEGLLKKLNLKTKAQVAVCNETAEVVSTSQVHLDTSQTPMTETSMSSEWNDEDRLFTTRTAAFESRIAKEDGSLSTVVTSAVVSDIALGSDGISSDVTVKQNNTVFTTQLKPVSIESTESNVFTEDTAASTRLEEFPKASLKTSISRKRKTSPQTMSYLTTGQADPSVATSTNRLAHGTTDFIPTSSLPGQFTIVDSTTTSLERTEVRDKIANIVVRTVTIDPGTTALPLDQVLLAQESNTVSIDITNFTTQSVTKRPASLDFTVPTQLSIPTAALNVKTEIQTSVEKSEQLSNTNPSYWTSEPEIDRDIKSVPTSAALPISATSSRHISNTDRASTTNKKRSALTKAPKSVNQQSENESDKAPNVVQDRDRESSFSTLPRQVSTTDMHSTTATERSAPPIALNEETALNLMNQRPVVVHAESKTELTSSTIPETEAPTLAINIGGHDVPSIQGRVESQNLAQSQVNCNETEITVVVTSISTMAGVTTQSPPIEDLTTIPTLEAVLSSAIKEEPSRIRVSSLVQSSEMFSTTPFSATVQGSVEPREPRKAVTTLETPSTTAATQSRTSTTRFETSLTSERVNTKETEATPPETSTTMLETAPEIDSIVTSRIGSDSTTRGTSAAMLETAYTSTATIPRTSTATFETASTTPERAITKGTEATTPVTSPTMLETPPTPSGRASTKTTRLETDTKTPGTSTATFETSSTTSENAITKGTEAATPVISPTMLETPPRVSGRATTKTARVETDTTTPVTSTATASTTETKATAPATSTSTLETASTVISSAVPIPPTEKIIASDAKKVPEVSLVPQTTHADNGSTGLADETDYNIITMTNGPRTVIEVDVDSITPTTQEARVEELIVKTEPNVSEDAKTVNEDTIGSTKSKTKILEKSSTSFASMVDADTHPDGNTEETRAIDVTSHFDESSRPTIESQTSSFATQTKLMGPVTPANLSLHVETTETSPANSEVPNASTNYPVNPLIDQSVFESKPALNLGEESDVSVNGLRTPLTPPIGETTEPVVAARPVIHAKKQATLNDQTINELTTSSTQQTTVNDDESVVNGTSETGVSERAATSVTEASSSVDGTITELPNEQREQDASTTLGSNDEPATEFATQSVQEKAEETSINDLGSRPTTNVDSFVSIAGEKSTTLEIRAESRSVVTSEMNMNSIVARDGDNSTATITPAIITTSRPIGAITTASASGPVGALTSNDEAATEFETQQIPINVKETSVNNLGSRPVDNIVAEAGKNLKTTITPATTAAGGQVGAPTSNAVTTNEFAMKSLSENATKTSVNSFGSQPPTDVEPIISEPDENSTSPEIPTDSESVSPLGEVKDFNEKIPIGAQNTTEFTAVLAEPAANVSDRNEVTVSSTAPENLQFTGDAGKEEIPGALASTPNSRTPAETSNPTTSLVWPPHTKIVVEKSISTISANVLLLEENAETFNVADEKN